MEMGALSEYAVSKKHTASLIQQQPLTLPIIHDRFKGIADSIGSDSSKAKKSILKGLFLDCSPLEAKYLTGNKRRNENWADRGFSGSRSFSGVQCGT